MTAYVSALALILSGVTLGLGSLAAGFLFLYPGIPALGGVHRMSYTRAAVAVVSPLVLLVVLVSVITAIFFAYFSGS